MARYTASWSGLNGTNSANTQLVNLLGGTTQRLLVRELYLVCTTAPTTAPLWAFGRSTARGTQSTSATSLSMDGADATAAAVLDLTWSGAPTFTNTAANRFRVKQMTAAVGQEAFWPFYDVPFVVPATSGAGAILWNVNASGSTVGVWAGHIVWDE
jgi:predicted dienelactone hydrolase